jgi:hypothetical protein
MTLNGHCAQRGRSQEARLVYPTRTRRPLETRDSGALLCLPGSQSHADEWAAACRAEGSAAVGSVELRWQE